MNEQNEPKKQRLLELLADRALFGLSSEEAKELGALQLEYPDVDDQGMDRIVALLESSNPADEPLPAALRAQIVQAGTGELAKPADARPSTGSNQDSSPVGARRDWIIAILVSAATFLLGALAFWQPEPETLSLQRQRDLLLADASDVIRIDWSPTDQAKAYSGDVVWSGEKQNGFMTFRGLPVNDRTKEQYQLWIFDAQQDEKFPIDGGVFDVESESVVIEIDAKLPVVSPAMFAITIEKPGGVVVSDRSRLPLLAKTP